MAETDAVGMSRVPDPISSPEGQLNPYPWYTEMRNNSPVRYDETRDCWDVFQYEDVKTILTDHETFSSAFDADLLTGPSDESAVDLSETLIMRDPPEHERLRGIVDEYFRPGYLRKFSDDFEELAHEQLDRVLETGTEFDFAAEFASPIPSIVIAEILGVPPSKRELLIEVGPGGEPTQRELKEYITGLVRERKDNPTDDILSEVIHATPEGEGMTEEEICQFCALLLLAGSQTTITLLSNAIWMFTKHDFISEIQSGAIDIETAIDEVLRYRPPVHIVTRKAAEDVEVHGKQIQEGERIVAWIGSAHRDPQQFENPETFDPERKPNRHMAFGSGIHFCLGAPLARLEAKTVLPVFFDRISDVNFATSERNPIMNPLMYGIQSLPISVSR
jgi:cytochrome P450